MLLCSSTACFFTIVTEVPLKTFWGHLVEYLLFIKKKQKKNSKLILTFFLSFRIFKVGHIKPFFFFYWLQWLTLHFEASLVHIFVVQKSFFFSTVRMLVEWNVVCIYTVDHQLFLAIVSSWSSGEMLFCKGDGRKEILCPVSISPLDLKWYQILDGVGYDLWFVLHLLVEPNPGGTQAKVLA